MTLRSTLPLSSWARRLLVLGLLLGLCAALGGLAAPSAHAQTALTVSTCDEPHLDAAIAQANSDNANDTITFACSGDIPLTSTLSITGSMTLDGSGQSVTLDGQNQVQVFTVGSVSFTLKALTIANGVGACCAGPGFVGGGLYNGGGTVTITNSTFSGNSASGDGGGLYNDGGTLSITNSTFSGNSASGDFGGGLLNANGGTLSITNSTFANNSVGYGGGGLANGDPFAGIPGGTVSITKSTFANNSSGTTGGGLYNEYSTVNISTSTFSGNSASNNGGGFGNDGTVNISTSTFSGNSADNGGGFSSDGTVNIGTSIVANNTGGDCLQVGTLNDQGYNLESGTSCGFTSTTSKQNTDPKLGPLASNGGPTQTMALLKGSPASDYIPLVSSLCPTTDQRGHKRPDNPKESACDIGAYES